MTTTGNRKTPVSKKRKTKNTTTSRSNNRRPGNQHTEKEREMYHEILVIIICVFLLILLLCNFGLIGAAGDAISSFMFGVFGFLAYIVPVMIFVAMIFWVLSLGKAGTVRKLIAGIVLFLMIGVFADIISRNSAQLTQYSLKELFRLSSTERNGGGALSGSLSYFMRYYLDSVGTVLIALLLSAISIILLTEKSLLQGLKKGGQHVREFSIEEAERRREYIENRRNEQQTNSAENDQEQAAEEEYRLSRAEKRAQKEEAARLKREAIENDRILRVDKKVSGVMLDTFLDRPNTEHRDDIHEITCTDSDYKESSDIQAPLEDIGVDYENINIRSVHKVTPPETKTIAENHEGTQGIRIHKEHIGEQIILPEPESTSDKKTPKKYMFPPLSRLQKGVISTGDSSAELKDTAYRLQETLKTFGVRVTITDISQGPSVTRYELQPEQGVKVSKIVGLADDIKLNLAATDIRIEAPIPGKAAIGIEVPNKDNRPVALRDLLESKEFREFNSNIAFAVGKDIAGKVVVSDIAKMPHMLIAGATGSGKSVCINTLIMSILYKAHPNDVKLIMIDPKVVELSVYNGIPHLLIPVVTDPKKASAALHWGVTEMEDRYRKFADFNVRDLKGYNQKVETMQENCDENTPEKMPQVVIIVDELADLMMVCPGEVEESICRLAQLARAAGIHLIIATQRPSVDVITGLIKANMPSRVAFSVSSGVDSRTILDMNGAEKLLGKGDMLFYPQGYTKPARIQGAFVSDREVSDVVDFLKNQSLGNTYAEDVEEKIQHIGAGENNTIFDGGDSELDELFEKAGRVIIEKESASIGMLQRAFKIGFNRAARIMDQLSEYGVVGEHEGTKPRKILMSPEQFEALIEDIL